MRKALFLLTVLVFPFVAVGLSVRLAFTETAVELLYRGLPPDRWGMKEEKRLELAKLGLKAVLSEEGMREFKEARLGRRKAFREKEVRHMEDVARLLEVFFPAVFFLGLLWLFGVSYLRDRKVLFWSGLWSLLLLSLIALLVFVNYEKAFELFHLLLFDPYSWRFRDEDTLLRVYPMEFWFKATLLVAVVSASLSLAVMTVGWWGRRTRPKGVP